MTVTAAVLRIFSELMEGPQPAAGFVLNPGDPGLLRSLARLNAAQASALPPDGGASIAAHVDHLRYGLSLLNRASAGENPFLEADWSAAWRNNQVSDTEWVRLRAGLAEEAHKWRHNFEALVDAGEMELTGVLASAAHLAYHLGAIRQIIPSTRGPAEGSQ